MDALILDASRKTASINRVPQPTPTLDLLLIKVHSIALNPVDALYVSNPLGSTGRVVGSDFAGTIAFLGESIPSTSGLQIGSRVAGFLQGACSVNNRPGAFAEFVVCPWDLVWNVPEAVSFEEAATVNLCGLTAAQVVYYRLGLKAPFEWSHGGVSSSRPQLDEGAAINFFIFGASTSVAMYAAQLVHRSMEASGVRIKLFGTASKGRFKILQAQPYRYDHLVDYHDPDWADKIMQLSGRRGIHYAFDCISEGNTVKAVAGVLREDGRMAIVRSREGGAWDADDFPIEPIYGAVWEGLGEEIQYSGLTVPKSPEARAFAVDFYKWLSRGGKLEPNPVRLMPGGLGRIVEDGFTLLGSGTMQDRDHRRTEAWMKPVAAEKLVYRLVP
jgi:NADPH:quinone reductase-like Zn-dependent oxidoreductase